MATIKKTTPKGTFPLPTTGESIDNIMDSRESRQEYFEIFISDSDNEEVFTDWLRDYLERGKA